MVKFSRKREKKHLATKAKVSRSNSFLACLVVWYHRKRLEELIFIKTSQNDIVFHPEIVNSKTLNMVQFTVIQ